MNLSKSKYCNGVQCYKMLWLKKYKPEFQEDIGNQAVFDNGTEVGELAKGLFGEYIDIDFNENLNQMIEDTKKACETKNVIITEASFVYDNNFCSVDILKKNGTLYEIYEVKSSTHVSDIYKDDISYQYYVLTNLGLNVKKASLVYINNEYVRNGNLEINKLFNIEDLTEIVISKQDEVKNRINEIREYMKQEEEPIDDIGTYCFNPYQCPFFTYCSRNLNKPNVFDVSNLSVKKKIELYKMGKYEFKDLLNVGLNKKQEYQIEFELNQKEPVINQKEIKEFLNTLSYPLYFLDFETFQMAIPGFDGVKPYMQIPFQYSLHYIEKEDGELKHTEYLGDGVNDPRRELAEQLVKDIPKDSCVLAYNMSFEKTRIKEMANLFPDLSDKLMNIYDNVKDLMIPFQKGDYYRREFQGSYSIKYVLPGLFPDDPSLNYHNLEQIHNGSEAMNSYAKMSNLSRGEQDVLRKNMLKYCGLDTFAMVKVWEYLKKIK